jgi:hypothetical protein
MRRLMTGRGVRSDLRHGPGASLREPLKEVGVEEELHFLESVL